MIIFNIIFGLAIYGLDIYFLFFEHTNYLLKDIASVLFVILGAINILFFYFKHTKKDKIISIIIFLGLVLGLAGDLILGKNFIVGGVLFGLGHLLYIIAFFVIKKISIQDFAMLLICFGIVFAIIFFPNAFKFGKYLPLILGYATIITIMLAKALSNVIFSKNRNIKHYILAIAGFLFFFSDFMLMIYNFSGTYQIIYDRLCLLTYYPAQIMFAISIIKFKKREKKL